MDMFKNHYVILGIPENASQSEIKKAYRRKAAETHPDKGGADEAFQEVQAAYDMLKNPETREEYDELLNAFRLQFEEYQRQILRNQKQRETEKKEKKEQERKKQEEQKRKADERQKQAEKRRQEQEKQRKEREWREKEKRAKQEKEQKAKFEQAWNELEEERLAEEELRKAWKETEQKAKEERKQQAAQKQKPKKQNQEQRQAVTDPKNEQPEEDPPEDVFERIYEDFLWLYKPEPSLKTSIVYFVTFYAMVLFSSVFILEPLDEIEKNLGKIFEDEPAEKKSPKKKQNKPAISEKPAEKIEKNEEYFLKEIEKKEGGKPEHQPYRYCPSSAESDRGLAVMETYTRTSDEEAKRIWHAALARDPDDYGSATWLSYIYNHEGQTTGNYENAIKYACIQVAIMKRLGCYLNTVDGILEDIEEMGGSCD